MIQLGKLYLKESLLTTIVSSVAQQLSYRNDTHILRANDSDTQDQIYTTLNWTLLN